MDCNTARLLLDYARPRPAELPRDDAVALEGHLHGCPECDALSRGGRLFDERLGQAVRAVPVPDGLRDRLLTRLAADRRAYRRRRLRYVGPVAAAAAVLLAVGLWWEWPRTHLPSPDLEPMVEYVSQNDNSRQSADTVTDWFHDKHPDRPMVAPREFDQRPLNYDLLAYAGLSDWQGQSVPMLLFANGRNQARVYVLSQKQFRLDELLREQPRVNSKGYLVAVIPCPDDPGLVYVFLFKGDSMAPFLTGAVPGIG